jgi:hypothetical protein
MAKQQCGMADNAIDEGLDKKVGKFLRNVSW